MKRLPKRTMKPTTYTGDETNEKMSTLRVAKKLLFVSPGDWLSVAFFRLDPPSQLHWPSKEVLRVSAVIRAGIRVSSLGEGNTVSLLPIVRARQWLS